MRNYLIDTGKLSAGVAPSYFLQSLVYNVPDEHFDGDHNATVYAILKHLWEKPVDNFVCQNGLHTLFGGTEEQWDVPNAHQTITAFVQLWDNWGQ